MIGSAGDDHDDDNAGGTARVSGALSPGIPSLLDASMILLSNDFVGSDNDDAE